MSYCVELNEQNFDKMLRHLHLALRKESRNMKSSFQFVELFRHYETIWKLNCEKIGVQYAWNNPERFRLHAFRFAQEMPTSLYSKTLTGAKNLILSAHG